MQLPERDTKFLNERGYKWEVMPDPSGSSSVIIHDLVVSGGGFSPERTDVMVRIPAQYPMTPLDMWYCDPPIRIAATGQFAPASEVVETHFGRNWQRFSRHLASAWNPAIDGLRSFFALIHRELQGTSR
jgi:hypothetical protein